MRGNIRFSAAFAVVLFAANSVLADLTETFLPARATIGPGGLSAYNREINNATGVAGPTPDANNQVSGWSVIRVVRNPLPPAMGDLEWTATSTAGNQFQLALFTLLNPTTVGQENFGMMANFDPTQTYVWPIITYQGAYVGPTDSATLTADTLIDPSQFLNPVGTSSTFTLAVDPVGKAIDLVYSPTPVPEPGTLGLVAVGAIAVWRKCRLRLCGTSRKQL